MKTELEGRSKRFSLELISVLKSFPRGFLGEVIGRQLLKSGTSIGANYREANRAGSKADFVHKVNLAEKEAAETVYWLELCEEAGLGASVEGVGAHSRRIVAFGRIGDAGGNGAVEINAAIQF